MNYILSYKYCNLNGFEYSGTDITSISDDVLNEVHTTVHSLTCFTQNIVTDRGYTRIHTTAVKLYLLHYLYNTCFTQNIVTYTGYICTTVFSSI